MTASAEGGLTEDAFRALARSAAWLFTTLHFTFHRRDATVSGPVEAWLSRPGRLRVRLDDGTEHVQLGTPWNNGSFVRLGVEVADVRPWPQQVQPLWRSDGLVDRRPEDERMDFDDPIWGSYDWVAMLDPVELSWHTTVTNLTVTQRDGRTTWWAELAALEEYEPRCGCCPLLWGEVSERAEGSIGGPTWIRQHPNVVYPETWLVGLDRATGIVVDLTPIGGSRPDAGFTVDLHAVDAELPDSLFRA